MRFDNLLVIDNICALSKMFYASVSCDKTKILFVTKKRSVIVLQKFYLEIKVPNF